MSKWENTGIERKCRKKPFKSDRYLEGFGGGRVRGILTQSLRIIG